MDIERENRFSDPLKDILSEYKIGNIASLAAGAEEFVGMIYAWRIRSLGITCRVTYDGAATAPCTVRVYVHHPSLGVDTIPLASFDVTLTAGAIVQRTVVIDSVEDGKLEVKYITAIPLKQQHV